MSTERFTDIKTKGIYMPDNIIIKLLSIQIPKVWELIKFVVTKAEEVDEKDLPAALNCLLHLLLSDKAQCWVRLDNDRNIISLLITQITIDKITARKDLHVRCLYSFRHVPSEKWQEDFDLLIRFGKQEKCDKITSASKHSRIWEIASYLGWKETYRLFSYDLE